MSVEENSNLSSLLDKEQLQMLIESGSPESIELFREILGLFEEESLRKLDDLTASVNSGNFEDLSRSAHALAGSSANIGGREVWQQAKKIEDLCKSGDGQSACELVPELKATYQLTITALKDYSNQLD
jgi:HPt (histidine-containing phosphotransfer) domain-containing protein